ncbi:hypothetical protein RRG08_038132 [Elysia crispata]|uniref:Uncharacterized protein n=1 Tax=Elysia crispata TaxID=231223 RepID=A0AAE1DP30_9GAST|nr:hypothetical protein RRG08_038132 [Elysia crispata]
MVSAGLRRIAPKPEIYYVVQPCSRSPHPCNVVVYIVKCLDLRCPPPFLSPAPKWQCNDDRSDRRPVNPAQRFITKPRQGKLMLNSISTNLEVSLASRYRDVGGDTATHWLISYSAEERPVRGGKRFVYLGGERLGKGRVQKSMSQSEK